MRYAITLSYDGSAFCGWQVQPGAPSVQASLEEALGKLLGRATPVTGAGRTDTAVNAIGYVAHFDAPDGIDSADFSYKLNAILPRSVVVCSVVPEASDFHARFGAVRREYTYFLHRGKDPFIEKFSYRCPWALDVEAMNKAAAMLVGRHDFSCFEKVGGDNKTSVCTVSEAFWKAYTPTHVALMGSPAPQDGDYLYFRISADRFLRNMVRAVVGTLLDVGRGRRSVEDFASLILPPGGEASRSAVAGPDPAAADVGTQAAAPSLPRRCLAGESVPGHALFLSRIQY